MAGAVEPRLDDLDPILGPVNAAHLHTPSGRAALALLCRAYGSNPPIPPSTVRVWIRSRLASTRPDLVGFAGSPAWAPAVAAARRRVADSGSVPGRSRLAILVARRLVGHLLSAAPAGVRGPRAVGARAAVAIVGVRALTNLQPDAAGPAAGIDSPRFGADELAVAAGVRRQAALGWLGGATEGGLARVGSKKGSSPTWRLEGLRGEGVAIADDHSPTIDALAALDSDTDPLAAAILSAGRTAGWGWLPGLGWREWTVFLADLGDLDPVQFGVGPTGVVRARRALRTAGLDADAVRADPTAVAVRLDELARVPGPDGLTAADRHRAATTDRARRVAVRRSEVERVRAAKDEREVERAAERKRAAAEKRKAARSAKKAGTPPARRSTTTRPSRTGAPAPTVDRRSLKLPAGFDPDRHRAGLAATVREKLGPDWTLDEVDETAGVAWAVRDMPATV